MTLPSPFGKKSYLVRKPYKLPRTVTKKTMIIKKPNGVCSSTFEFFRYSFEIIRLLTQVTMPLVTLIHKPTKNMPIMHHMIVSKGTKNG